MKWIFALDAGGIINLKDLIEVALTSARQNTSFDAVCLFDGEKGEFWQWLEERGVEVIQVRSRFYEDITALAKARNVSPTGMGAFLRLEIPRVVRERGWKDEFVLYTDCDVIFERDPGPLLESLRPRLFAVAPETFKDRPLYMNTGVMWMNVDAFDDPQLEAWVRHNLEQCLHFAYDQGALRVFYNPPHRLAWRLGISNSLFYGVMSRVPLRTWKWEDLPAEMNWKPYWGPHPDPYVIHFHGLKPTQRSQIGTGKLDEIVSEMHTPFFDECAAKWDEWLKQARAL